jgi:hypothetical protein
LDGLEFGKCGSECDLNLQRKASSPCGRHCGFGDVCDVNVSWPPISLDLAKNVTKLGTYLKMSNYVKFCLKIGKISKINVPELPEH